MKLTKKQSARIITENNIIVAINNLFILCHTHTNEHIQTELNSAGVSRKPLQRTVN